MHVFECLTDLASRMTATNDGNIIFYKQEHSSKKKIKNKDTNNK